MRRNIHQNTALFETCQWLRQQYWGEEKSTREIAKILGVSFPTVLYWMKKFDIPRRKEGFQKGNQLHVGRKLTSEHKEKIGFAGRDEKNPRWKGGQKAYHNRKARTVWEEYWREEVPKGYVVHHVDRNVANNDICNLALLTFKYHMQVHRGGVPVPEETRKKISDTLKRRNNAIRGI